MPLLKTMTAFLSLLMVGNDFFYSFPFHSRTMLDHGADLESHTKDLWTPLHLSAYNGHVEFVRELLEGRGAEVNARETTHGQTALHLCAKVIFLFFKKTLGNVIDACHYLQRIRSHQDLGRLLVSQGADVNAADGEGDTAMHLVWDSPN